LRHHDLSLEGIAAGTFLWERLCIASTANEGMWQSLNTERRDHVLPYLFLYGTGTMTFRSYFATK